MTTYFNAQRQQAARDGKDAKIADAKEKKAKAEQYPDLSGAYLDSLRDIVRNSVDGGFNPDEPRTIATAIYNIGRYDKYDKYKDGKDDHDTVIKLAVWLENWQAHEYFADFDSGALSTAIAGIGYAAEAGMVTEPADVAIDLVAHINKAKDIIKRERINKGYHEALHFATSISGLGKIANAEITNEEAILLTQLADIALESATILNECGDLKPGNCEFAVLGLGRLAEAGKLSASANADIAIELASKIPAMIDMCSDLDLANTILGLAKLAMAGKLTQPADIAIKLGYSFTDDVRPIELANAIYGIGVLLAAKKISSGQINNAKKLILELVKWHQQIINRRSPDRASGSQIVIGLGFAGLPIPDDLSNEVYQPKPSTLQAEVADILGKQYHLQLKKEEFINGFFCDLVIGKNIFEIDGVVHTKKRHQYFAQLRDNTLSQERYVVDRINIYDFSNDPKRIARHIVEFLAKNSKEQQANSSLMASSISVSSSSSAGSAVSRSLPLPSGAEKEKQAKEKAKKLEEAQAELERKEKQAQEDKAERARKEAEAQAEAKQAQLKKEQELKKRKHDKRVNQKIQVKQKLRSQIVDDIVTVAIKEYSSGCCGKVIIPTNNKEAAKKIMLAMDDLSLEKIQHHQAEIIECVQSAIKSDPALSFYNFWSNQYIIDLTTLQDNLRKIASEQKQKAAVACSKKDDS